jgi:hypothetical protein
MKYAYKFLFGRLVGKRPLERHRHRWEDNIVMNHKEIDWEIVNTI